MKMNPKIVMSSCLAFTVVLVLVVLHYNRPPAHDVHAAIVYDRSKSPRDGCESIKELTEKSLSLVEGRRANCTLRIFATGEKLTSYEPVNVALPFLPRKSGRILEGKNRFAEEKSKFLNNTYTQCSELNRTEQSPIYLSVKRAIEYLKAIDPNGTSDLYLFVQSDLEENVEESIKSAIRASSKVKGNLPSPLDNSRVNITFCGYSETSSQYIDIRGQVKQGTPMRNAKSTDRLLEVWPSLFTHPELVTFNPVCSGK